MDEFDAERGRADDDDNDDDDLYGDLVVECAGPPDRKADTESMKVDATVPREEHCGKDVGAALAEENRRLAATLADAERELERMMTERAVLVKNMSCIYKTAKAEIARKDCIIEDLRKKAFQ